MKRIGLVSKKRLNLGFESLHILAMSVIFLNLNCSAPPTQRAEQTQFKSVFESEQAAGVSGENRTRAELEDSILRFESRFNSLMNDAFQRFSQESSNTLRRQAMRIKLNYSAHSLAIALGAIPEQNLLDLIVFTELILSVYQDHWFPTVFKDEGRPVLIALKKASEDLDIIALKYITRNQLNEIKRLVEVWHDQHPNVIEVESVRLSDFSPKAGARALQIQNNISGVLAPVKGATVAADQALILAERGLFYAQRAPFLMRMQLTAALQDVLNEAEATFSEQPPTEIMRESQMMLRDLRPVLTEVRQLVELLNKNPKLLESNERVIENTLLALREFNQILRSGALSQIKMNELADRIKTEVRGLIFIFLFVCAFLILFSGVIYVLAKLTYEHFSFKKMNATKEAKNKNAA